MSLNDPISEVTRKERKMLLGLSMLSIFLTQAGVLPSKISALGVDLTATDQKVFLVLILMGLIYFIAGFIVYALSDLIVWRHKLNQAYIKDYEEYMLDRDQHPPSPHDMELDEERARAFKRNRIWRNLTKPVSVVRSIFDFALPVAVGLISVIFVALDAFK